VILHAFSKSLGEGARVVIEVPVEGLGKLQALGDVEADSVDVRDE
jgi:hypothetical protein